jgi:polysaccharide biosynthesis protein PslG
MDYPRPLIRRRQRVSVFLNAALVALILLSAVLAGCARPSTATPTPTKTPKTAAVATTPLPAATTAVSTAPAPTAASTQAAPAATAAASATATRAAAATKVNTPAAPKATDTAVPPTATSAPALPKGKLRSPEYGMQAFLWWRPEVADRDLGLIKDAGFGWVKQTFAWRDIEGAGKGQFEWERPDRIVDQIQQYGLKLLVRVDSQPEWAGGKYPENGPPNNMQDFADFVKTLATRYKGRIAAYQIWNEPNLNVPGRSEWGGKAPNPTEYTTMLKAAYAAVKSADPDALVVSAGLAPTTRSDDVAMPDLKFLQGMYDAGAKEYFDLLGAHAAGYKVPPDTDPAVVAKDPALNNNDPSPEQMKRIYCFRHVEDVRKVMVDNGDADKQVAVLEFGWTIDPRPESPYNWHAVTDFQQGEYLVAAYQYAKANWAPWIGLMSLIYMPNSDWKPEQEEFWWGVIEAAYPELKLRPAYVMLKQMPK